MYEVFFKFYSCNEDIKPSAAFSCRHIKYKIHAPLAPKHVIFILKIQKFSVEGAQPRPQTPPPAGGGHPLSGRGTPPPAPTPLGACGASIFAPSALTHAPPTRKSGYGPGVGVGVGVLVEGQVGIPPPPRLGIADHGRIIRLVRAWLQWTEFWPF